MSYDHVQIYIFLWIDVQLQCKLIDVIVRFECIYDLSPMKTIKPIHGCLLSSNIVNAESTRVPFDFFCFCFFFSSKFQFQIIPFHKRKYLHLTAKMLVFRDFRHSTVFVGMPNARKKKHFFHIGDRLYYLYSNLFVPLRLTLRSAR